MDSHLIIICSLSSHYHGVLILLCLIFQVWAVVCAGHTVCTQRLINCLLNKLHLSFFIKSSSL